MNTIKKKPAEITVVHPRRSGQNLAASPKLNLKRLKNRKGTRRFLDADGRNARRKWLQSDFLDSSEAESDSDSSESSSDDDSSCEADERSHTQKGEMKMLSSSTKENVPPPSTSAGKQSDNQSELSKTNALLHTFGLSTRIRRDAVEIKSVKHD